MTGFQFLQWAQEDVCQMNVKHDVKTRENGCLQNIILYMLLYVMVCGKSGEGVQGILYNIIYIIYNVNKNPCNTDEPSEDCFHTLQ